MVMRKILPCISIEAVIFPDSSPLPFSQIRAPSAPMLFFFSIFEQTELFSIHGISSLQIFLKIKVYKEKDQIT
jgi:hypothetical protein